MKDDADSKVGLLKSLTISRDDPSGETRGGRGWMLLPLGVLIGALVSWAGFVLLTENNAAAPATIAGQGDAASEQSRATTRSGNLVASGYVVARRQATVAAEVTGRVVEVRIDEGQWVQRGQILAVLDRSVIAADHAAAAAQARSAVAAIDVLRAELEDARRILQRSEELNERGFVTQADLTRNRTRVASLEAQVERSVADAEFARANLDRVQQQAGRYSIRAPFSGVVIDKNAQAGEIISPVSAGGGFTRTGICTLVDMSSLEIEVDVNEQYIARIEEQQEVVAVMDAYPDDELPAYVIATIPAADRARSTVRVRIGFREIDPRLLPNMAVRVTFLEARD